MRSKEGLELELELETRAETGPIQGLKLEMKARKGPEA